MLKNRVIIRKVITQKKTNHHEENTVDYLNTEETLNGRHTNHGIFDHDQTYHIEDQHSHDKINDDDIVLKEESNVKKCFQKPSDENKSDKKNSVCLEEGDMNLPDDVSYNKEVDQQDEASLSSDIDNVELNQQFHFIQDNDHKTILKLKKSSTHKHNPKSKSLKREFPYHIEEENLNFNEYDLNQVRNSKLLKNSNSLKATINHEVLELKHFHAEPFLILEKEPLKNSFLDHNIKREMSNKLIKHGGLSLVEDMKKNNSEQDDSIDSRGCCASANAKCIIC